MKRNLSECDNLSLSNPKTIRSLNSSPIFSKSLSSKYFSIIYILVLLSQRKLLYPPKTTPTPLLSLGTFEIFVSLACPSSNPPPPFKNQPPISPLQRQKDSKLQKHTQTDYFTTYPQCVPPEPLV